MIMKAGTKKKRSSRTISVTKRSNQKKNKLIKKGKLKPNTNSSYNPTERKKKFQRFDPYKADNDRVRQQEAEKRQQVEEEEVRDQLIKELDPEEVDYILKAEETKSLARYEHASRVSVKDLLPIKTKEGILQQTLFIDNDDEEKEEGVATEQDSEKDEEVDEDKAPDNVTVIELLSRRKEILTLKRVTIGSLATNFLECPEERIPILEKLIKMLIEDVDPTVSTTIFCLVSTSIVEIFKDVLPSYKIRQQPEGVKLKKDTLKLQKYESALLICVKNFLVRLENRLKCRDASSVHALDVMGQLLVAHPHFNYSQNMVNVLSGYINSKDHQYREVVFRHFKSVFKGDKRGEISLIIVRKLNAISKTKKKIFKEVIEVMGSLPIKDLNIDKMKDDAIESEKKSQAKKKLLTQMSKREKKNKKKMEKLEKELLESKGEESSNLRYRLYTDVTKLTFAIYFRILKATANGVQSPLLVYVLKGLSKFSHSINIDFFQDLLQVFAALLSKDRKKPLTLLESLHVIKTVFVVLSGQGEFLNIDPVRFYNCLYSKLLEFNIHSEGIETAISSLMDMIIKRKKKVSKNRVFAFVKRIATISTGMGEYATLGFMAFLREAFVAKPELKSMLEMDEYGSGLYSSDVEDPENANATNTVLWELHALRNHYNERVSSIAKNILNFNSSLSSNSSLPRELRKDPLEIMICESKYVPMDILKPKIESNKRRYKNVFKEDEADPSKRVRTERLDRWMNVLYSDEIKI
ncbi:LOW QUALITY PROTEIN: nucleolar complex protein 3 homolog [Lepeophtheirus salmonis]|uniref:LOW QUALITY PROTEIN: nucleolar complex protein 3 homolog n=1 Tax=Lepeophtheirus salmonis TaxID=72036 RepID=UPI003AF3583B